MKTPEQIYEAEIARCQRSPEWKCGALAGLRKGAAPSTCSRSPFASGTAQDDAWRAGLAYGRDIWRYEAQLVAA